MSDPVPEVHRRCANCDTEQSARLHAAMVAVEHVVLGTLPESVLVSVPALLAAAESWQSSRRHVEAQ